MTRCVVIVVALSWSICAAALAQPANSDANPPAPVPSNPDTTLPGEQRFQIRQDTRARRDDFLKRREMEMQQQAVQSVTPLPAQRISPLPTPQE